MIFKWEEIVNEHSQISVFGCHITITNTNNIKLPALLEHAQALPENKWHIHVERRLYTRYDDIPSWPDQELMGFINVSFFDSLEDAKEIVEKMIQRGYKDFAIRGQKMKTEYFNGTDLGRMLSKFEDDFVSEKSLGCKRQQGHSVWRDYENRTTWTYFEDTTPEKLENAIGLALKGDIFYFTSLERIKGNKTQRRVILDRMIGSGFFLMFQKEQVTFGDPTHEWYRCQMKVPEFVDVK